MLYFTPLDVVVGVTVVFQNCDIQCYTIRTATVTDFHFCSFWLAMQTRKEGTERAACRFSAPVALQITVADFTRVGLGPYPIIRRFPVNSANSVAPFFLKSCYTCVIPHPFPKSPDVEAIVVTSTTPPPKTSAPHQKLGKLPQSAVGEPGPLAVNK